MIKSATIDISEQGVLITQVEDSGAYITKNVDIQSLRETIAEDLSLSTGLLPLGVRMYRRQGQHEYIVMEVPPAIREVHYTRNNKKHTFKIPLPWTLWFFKLRNEGNQKNLAWSNVYAMKGPIVSEKITNVYTFPMSNTDGYICWGNQRLPSWKNLLGLASVPDIFFAAPFNSDLDYPDKYIEFQNEHGDWISGTFALFEEIDGTDVFPDEILTGAHTLEEALRYFFEH